jgi:hypothetical protein
MRCQIFNDPLYGSELYVTFEPEWVVECEDRTKGFIFRKPQPATYLRFNNGQEHVVVGHWSEKIKTAQAEARAKKPQTEPGA